MGRSSKRRAPRSTPREAPHWRSRGPEGLGKRFAEPSANRESRCGVPTHHSPFTAQALHLDPVAQRSGSAWHARIFETIALEVAAPSPNESRHCFYLSGAVQQSPPNL